MAATLDFSFREQWRALKQGLPGRRFQDRYKQAQQSEGKRGSVQRILVFAAAVVCVAIGVVLTVVPGPAVVFFFMAGGLLANESLFIARLMDGMEVRGRRVLAWAKPRWQRLPSSARVMLLLAGGAGSLALMYVMYRFFSD